MCCCHIKLGNTSKKKCLVSKSLLWFSEMKNKEECLTLYLKLVLLLNVKRQNNLLQNLNGPDFCLYSVSISVNASSSEYSILSTHTHIFLVNLCIDIN